MLLAVNAEPICTTICCLCLYSYSVHYWPRIIQDWTELSRTCHSARDTSFLVWQTAILNHFHYPARSDFSPVPSHKAHKFPSQESLLVNFRQENIMISWSWSISWTRVLADELELINFMCKSSCWSVGLINFIHKSPCWSDEADQFHAQESLLIRWSWSISCTRVLIGELELINFTHKSPCCTMELINFMHKSPCWSAQDHLQLSLLLVFSGTSGAHSWNNITTFSWFFRSYT